MLSAPRPAADRRIENLERLAVLRADGVLTQEEFEGEKRRILGDRAPVGRAAPSDERMPTRLGARLSRSAGSQLGWLVLGLALLALAGWITLASPEPRQAAATIAPEPVIPPAGPVPPATLEGLTPQLLAGGWASERTGCNLGDRDLFDYFEADGRYGGWGGFGGYTAEGRWALDGTRLVETITDRTDNNEARNPQRLPSPDVRTFDVVAWAKDALSLRDAGGAIARLVRCPDAHFEFATKG